MATKIINSGSVVSCAEYAFRNSAIGDLKPESNGAIIAGSVLVNIDENNLRRDVFVRQCIGDRRSNASSSNDGNLAAHKYSFLKYP